MLSATDLAQMQSALNATVLATTATVLRGGTSLGYTMPDGSALRCKVTAATASSKAPASPEEVTLRRWKILLPSTLAGGVLVGDTVQALSGTYIVVQVPSPSTFQLSLVVEAYQLYDGSGNPLYFSPNATLQVLRRTYNSGTKQTSAPANHGSPFACRVNDMANELRVAGIAPSFDLFLVCDGAVDLADDDQLSGYTPASTAVLTVQHVATHTLGGWVQKTALIKVQKQGGG